MRGEECKSPAFSSKKNKKFIPAHILCRNELPNLKVFTALSEQGFPLLRESPGRELLQERRILRLPALQERKFPLLPALQEQEFPLLPALQEREFPLLPALRERGFFSTTGSGVGATKTSSGRGSPSKPRRPFP